VHRLIPDELEDDIKAQYGEDFFSVGVSLVNKSSDVYIIPDSSIPWNKTKGHKLVADPSTELSRTLEVWGEEGPLEYVFKEEPDEPTASSVSSHSAGGDVSVKSRLVQIVLHDNRKVVQKFSRDATVEDLYRHIML
jgi:hypothetical protein